MASNIQAVLYVHANPESYDLNNVTVSGFSAGGCLALGVCVALGRYKIRAVSCMYPSVNLSRDRSAPQPIRVNPSFRSGVKLSDRFGSIVKRSYIPPDVKYKDPLLDPLYADPTCFPDNVYIACGDADTLYPEDLEFIEKLRKEGNAEQRKHAQFVSIPNEAHAWDLVPRAKESIETRQLAYQGAFDNILASRLPTNTA